MLQVLHIIYPTWVQCTKLSYGVNLSEKSFFGMLSNMSSKCWPFMWIFILGNKKKSFGAKSDEYGGWLKHCTTNALPFHCCGWTVWTLVHDLTIIAISPFHGLNVTIAVLPSKMWNRITARCSIAIYDTTTLTYYGCTSIS